MVLLSSCIQRQNFQQSNIPSHRTAVFRSAVRFQPSDWPICSWSLWRSALLIDLWGVRISEAIWLANAKNIRILVGYIFWSIMTKCHVIEFTLQCLVILVMYYYYVLLLLLLCIIIILVMYYVLLLLSLWNCSVHT